MHELAVTRSIVDVVVRNATQCGAHRVVRVKLVVGEMRSFEQRWVQSYFDRFAEGTIAEGAQLEIEYTPMSFHCHDCGETFRGKSLMSEQRIRCVNCGSGDYILISGDELLIRELEVA